MFQFLQWTAVSEHSDIHLYHSCKVNHNLLVVCGLHLCWLSASFCHTVTVRQSNCGGIRRLFVETISHLKWIKVPQSVESFAANTIGGGHSWTSELHSLFARSDHRSSSGFSHCLHTVWSYLSQIGSTLVIVHYRKNFPFVIFLNHSATIST